MMVTNEGLSAAAKQGIWKAIWLYMPYLRSSLVAELSSLGHDPDMLNGCSNLDLVKVSMEQMEKEGFPSDEGRHQFFLHPQSIAAIADRDWPVIWEINNAFLQFDHEGNLSAFDPKYWDEIMSKPELPLEKEGGFILFSRPDARASLFKDDDGDLVITIDGFDLSKRRVNRALGELKTTVSFQFQKLSKDFRDNCLKQIPHANPIKRAAESATLDL